jgi:hypothetical protein
MMGRIVMIKLLPHRKDTKDPCASRLYNNKTFYRKFMNDLSHTKQRAYIESPFITAKRMQILLPVFEKLRKRNVRITVNTRCPDEHEGEYINQAFDAVVAMQELGIKVFYTVKHHRKLTVIDDNILWEGSLNILSQNDSCEIMRRSVSERLVRQMVDFLGFD